MQYLDPELPRMHATQCKNQEEENEPATGFSRKWFYVATDDVLVMDRTPMN